MTDEIDRANDRVDEALGDAIAERQRAAAAIPAGTAGDCEWCGEWSGRLVMGAPATARAACERSGYLVDCLDWHHGDAADIVTYRVDVGRTSIGLVVTQRHQRVAAHGVRPCTPAPAPTEAEAA